MFALPKRLSKMHFQNMNKHTLSIQEDTDGELFFEIPPEILAKLNWQEGDDIEFIEQSDGLILRKHETNRNSERQ